MIFKINYILIILVHNIQKSICHHSILIREFYQYLEKQQLEQERKNIHIPKDYQWTRQFEKRIIWKKYCLEQVTKRLSNSISCNGHLIEAPKSYQTQGFFEARKLISYGIHFFWPICRKSQIYVARDISFKKMYPEEKNLGLSGTNKRENAMHNIFQWKTNYDASRENLLH